jgi:hypothetical protein
MTEKLGNRCAGAAWILTHLAVRKLTHPAS